MTNEHFLYGAIINKEKWTIELVKFFFLLLLLKVSIPDGRRLSVRPVKHGHNHRLSTQQGRCFTSTHKKSLGTYVLAISVFLPHKTGKRGVPPSTTGLPGLRPTLTGISCQDVVRPTELVLSFSPSRHRYLFWSEEGMKTKYVLLGVSERKRPDCDLRESWYTQYVYINISISCAYIWMRADDLGSFAGPPRQGVSPPDE